jgi:hypothetical protein
MNSLDVICANFLISPLVLFILWAVTWLLIGGADFLDGFFYWRIFRHEAASDPPRIETAPAREAGRGGGCWWVALLVVIGIVLLPFVWR